MIFGIICFVLLMLLAVLLLPRHYEQIPLIEQLRFGMSPAEARICLGKPEKVSKSIYSPSISYTYYKQLGEYQAEITASFIKVYFHYELVSVYISYIDIPIGSIDQLYNHLISVCRSDYCNKMQYYEKRDEDKTNLGIQKEAVFVDCEITRSQTDVNVFFSRLY